MINQFTNTGQDDRTLEYLIKSVNAMDIPDEEKGEKTEELFKAIDKSGLVQKEVQVKGKNGKVFTRKQWVKSGGDDTSTSSSSKFKFTLTKQDAYGDSYTPDKQYRLRLSLFGTQTTYVAQKFNGRTYEDIHNHASGSYHEARRALKEYVENLYKTQAQSQISDTKDVKSDTKKDNTNSLQGKTGEYNGIKYKIHTNNIFDRLNNQHNYSVAEGQIKTYGFCIEDETDRGKSPVAQCVDNDSDVDGIVAQLNGKSSSSSDSKKDTTVGSLNSVKNDSKHDTSKDTKSSIIPEPNKTYSVIIGNSRKTITNVTKNGNKYEFNYVRSNGTVDNKRYGISAWEWDTSAKELSTTIKDSSTSSTKLSKEDAKKKTQSFTSKVGKSDKERSDFMDKAKAQGITWKKSDHVGINWMRCCMAMNKHFENGGSWDGR